eukprot:gb/GECH01003759.1/.p1 GENE.gb/GECH01003759.1/~~gb/GECH01003759.1/.p1  ORF type:complete len:357 (+),score=83.31 gb/GECH01003759.1/:1-1071(+)
MSISELPQEILCNIAIFCSPETVISFRSLNRRLLHQLAIDNNLWYSLITLRVGEHNTPPKVKKSNDSVSNDNLIFQEENQLNWSNFCLSYHYYFAMNRTEKQYFPKTIRYIKYSFPSIILLGSNVGKSTTCSMLVSKITNIYSVEQYRKLIPVNPSSKRKVDPYNLEKEGIWAQIEDPFDSYESLLDQEFMKGWLRSSDIIVFMFDLTDSSSLDILFHIQKQLYDLYQKRLLKKCFLLVLAGNQLDRAQDDPSQFLAVRNTRLKAARLFSSSKIPRFSVYHEFSALKATSVDNLFQTMIREYLKVFSIRFGLEGTILQDPEETLANLRKGKYSRRRERKGEGELQQQEIQNCCEIL